MPLDTFGISVVSPSPQHKFLATPMPAQCPHCRTFQSIVLITVDIIVVWLWQMCLNQQCVNVDDVVAPDCGNCSENGVSYLQILLRLSSSRSEQNIGRRVVSIWHDRWQYLSHHSSQHPMCPNLLSVCFAMSSLVVRLEVCGNGF